MDAKGRVMRYQEWIAANCPEPLGKCAEYTKAMLEAFPELRRVRGHYYDMMWGERGHWWLVDPDGNIVDPTAEQFPTKGGGHYEEWNESDTEPTGRCMNCGDLCYSPRFNACSDECDAELMACFR